MKNPAVVSGVDGVTVLIAEDHDAALFAMSEYLRAKGYAVVQAVNGEQAVRAAGDAHPTVVLMDIQMPKVDGIAAARTIRAIDGLSHVPIIAVTALASAKDRELCLDAGFNEVVVKPVRLHDLLGKIEGVIKRA